MEFVLLPLLLLLGLATALDGGDDDNRDDTGDENDVLTGAGSDRVYGGIGDDVLTLEDRAVGLGGVGDDTIHARDEAVGYGLEGDDSLTGEDNATIKGGAGDDWLSAEDEAAADGGSGDDWLTLAGDANGSGGDGNDTLTASGEAVIHGGAGNDVLIYQDTALVSRPEVGDDTYVLDHASEGGASLGFEYNSTDAGDRIAIHLGTDDLSNFTFRTVSGSNDGWDDARGDITEIFITETLPDGETKESYLSIRGVYGFPLRGLILYGEEIGHEVDWQEYFGENDFIEASGSETVRGGEGNDHIDLQDSAVGYGDAGNDRIDLEGDAAAYGGAGEDLITHHRTSDSNVSYGGDGNDTIMSHSFWGSDGADTLYGGAGNDGLTNNGTGQAFLYGGEGDDELRGGYGPLASGTLEGGVGNDTLTLSGRTEGYGGAGDDALIASVGNTSLAGGAGNDIFAVDWRDADVAGTTVTDFVAGQDKLAVLVGTRDLDTLRLRITEPEGSEDTVVELYSIVDPDEVPPIARFTLQGVSDFDPNDLILSGADLSDPLEWTADPAWTETITGSVDADTITLNDSQVGLGEGGNDTIIANDEALAYGGAGEDSLRGNDSATVRGGAGNDSLTASFAAEAYGEAGDDVMLSFGNAQYSVQPSLYGGGGNDSLSGDGDLYGGAGNDLIEPDADGSLFNGVDSYSGAVYGGDGDDTIRGGISDTSLTGSVAFHGEAGDDHLSAEGRTSLYGDDGDDEIIGNGTLEGGAGDDRLDLGHDRDVSTDRGRSLLYGQADGGDGNDTITAASGVQLDDTYTTSGSMAIRGGAGDDFIAASDIYAIDAGTGDDTVSMLSDDTSGRQDVTLGAGSDVLLADVAGVAPSSYYGIGAVVTDFNPAEDQLAIILEQGATAPVVTYEWDVVRGGTDVICDDGVRFFLEGVNHQVTPLSVSFYASEAALQAGTPYATA